MLPAAPVVKHANRLRAAGLGIRTIATRAGTTPATVSRLLGRGNKRGTVTRAVSEGILGISVAEPAPGAHVPSAGTTRRLQALVTIGWTQLELARRLGWRASNLPPLVQGHQQFVNYSTARAVRAVYDELSMTFGPAQRSRTIAKQHGWLPPLAWDEDTIDDPNFQPVGVLRHKFNSGINEEDIAELRLDGYTTEQIGMRLGVQAATIIQIESRARRAA